MNNKHLLVKAITLAFRDSQLPNSSKDTTLLVKKAVESLKLPEVQVGLDKEKEILLNLAKTAQNLIKEEENGKTLTEVLQQLKIDCDGDENLFDAIAEGIVNELSEEETKRVCLGIKQHLKQYFKDEEAKKLLFDRANQLRFKENEIDDIGEYMKQIIVDLEGFTKHLDEKTPGVVSEVNLNDLNSVEETFKTIKEREEGLGVLKTGFQRINKMLRGGLDEGKFLCIGALQHNHKTGFSLALFRQFLMYNKPTLRDPSKKPLMIRIGTEDSIEDNLLQLYSNIVFAKEGIAPDLTNIDISFVSKYVIENLTVNGYDVRLMRVNPSDWTYSSICDEVIKAETEGYEVKLVMVDYLPMIPTKGCEQGPHGHDLRDMVRRIRNFMSARNITFVTPWQLSSDAVRLQRAGINDFVKELPGRNYYAGSTQVAQEFDIEIFIHIEYVNGQAWLTCQRGKHRKPGNTPEKDRYCALPFHPEGGLQDDINGKDLGRSKPGSEIHDNGVEEAPFWDMG